MAVRKTRSRSAGGRKKAAAARGTKKTAARRKAGSKKAPAKKLGVKAASKKKSASKKKATRKAVGRKAPGKKKVASKKVRRAKRKSKKVGATGRRKPETATMSKKSAASDEKPVAGRRSAARKKRAPAAKATRKPARRRTAAAGKKKSPTAVAPKPPVPPTRTDPEQTSLFRAPEAGAVAGAPAQRIGRVDHYFARVGAASVQLEQGEVRVGDLLHIRGHTTDFTQRVEQLEVAGATIDSARAGQTVGIQTSERVRRGDTVYWVPA